jgi:hypothetical protein
MAKRRRRLERAESFEDWIILGSAVTVFALVVAAIWWWWK